MTDTRNNGGPAAGARYQHRKGGTYRVMALGRMQAEAWYLPGCMEAGPSVDMEKVVIYQSEHDAKVWVRPIAEFADGRFTLITARSPSSKEA